MAGAAALASIRPPLVVRWRAGATAGFGPAAPIVIHNIGLVANRKGEVHAIHLDNGRRLGVARFGNSIEGSPAVGGELLFVPVAWGGRAVVAYDLKRGVRRWTERGVPVEAGLLLTDDALVSADVEGNVSAYRPGNGALLWRAERVAASFKAAPLRVQSDRVVVAGDEGRVTLLALTDGQVLWSRMLTSPVYETGVVWEGRIVLPTTRGRIVALDAGSGAPLWTVSLPDTLVRFTTPAVAGGSMVIGASDGKVRSIDLATGSVRWTGDAGAAVIASPFYASNTIYVGTTDAHLVALDVETGVEQWRQELKGRVKSAMEAYGGGLVVLAEPNLVYCFAPVGSAAYRRPR